MRRTIEVTVSREGATTIQTKGFAGSSCREASRTLEQALGAAVAEQLTSEFHQLSDAVQVTARQG
jgi:hypothetical protein